MNFAVPAGHRMKMKESEKIYKYLDLVRELKKRWNMWVTMIPTVVGALGIFPKGLKKKKTRGIENQSENRIIQTTKLLRWIRILRNVLET